jgi:hypothetical protein
MLKTIEAVVEPDGRVRLLEEVKPPVGSRVLVTLLEGEIYQETALLSEAALAEDWDREEEDQAWQSLQLAK